MENNETVESKREIECPSSWFHNMKNNVIAEHMRGDWYFYLLKVLYELLYDCCRNILLENHFLHSNKLTHTQEEHILRKI